MSNVIRFYLFSSFLLLFLVAAVAFLGTFFDGFWCFANYKLRICRLPVMFLWLVMCVYLNLCSPCSVERYRGFGRGKTNLEVVQCKFQFKRGISNNKKKK